MKRILVDAHIFDKSIQGTATYIKGLYNALVKCPGVEIFLCATNLDSLKMHFPDPRFRFIQLSTGSKIKRLAFELPRIIKEHNIDYAHFQYITPIVKNCKFINTVHDVLFLDYPEYFSFSYRFVKGNLFKFSAKRSDLVLTVSEYSRVALNRHFGIERNSIHITPNAIQVNDELVVDVREKYKLGKYILFVSRYEPRKNHIGLLEAYVDLKLKDQGFDLVFIGSKTEPIELNAYTQLLEAIPNDLRDNVRFFEHVSYQELSGFYRHATCFVFPSFAEGFGIPPIEAAILGTKVLCSNTTSMADFDFFKYRFDPKDAQDLSNKLKLVLADEQYPFEEIKSSIGLKYNWERIASDLHKLVIQ